MSTGAQLNPKPKLLCFPLCEKHSSLAFGLITITYLLLCKLSFLAGEAVGVDSHRFSCQKT